MASSRAHLRFIFISIHRNFSHVFMVEPKGSLIWLQHILFSFIFFYVGTELAERICVMGISMNLVTYLVGVLNLPSADSATIVTNVMGTLNLLGLLGGFIADAKLGRYLTVAISAIIAALVC